MELGYLLINGLEGPFACHMGHIGLGPHPKSKQALSVGEDNSKMCKDVVLET
jgi:hypothetical protein